MRVHMQRSAASLQPMPLPYMEHRLERTLSNMGNRQVLSNACQQVSRRYAALGNPHCTMPTQWMLQQPTRLQSEVCVKW